MDISGMSDEERSKRHRKYLHFQMDVILSLRVKIRTRTKGAKKKPRLLCSFGFF